MNAFQKIWAGQLISALGSGLTAFGLGVWVYLHTGSITQFAMISLVATVPGLLAAFVAGPVIDRSNRCRVIMLSDLIAAAVTILIPVLLLINRLTLPWIYVIVSIISICASFRWPAYSAAVSVLVPIRALGRANGMVQLSDAAAEIVPPITAGFLIGIIGIRGLATIDFSTYLFAIAMTAMVVARTLAPRQQGRTNQPLFREGLYGWHYLRERPGLMGLLVYFAVLNFLLGLVTVLATPMILSFASVRTLGAILSFGGSGMLIGALLMSAWGGLKQHISTILLFGFLGGLGIGIAGLRPSPRLTAAGAFTYFFSVPIINAASQAIWQSKVEVDVQGRVFSIRRMIASLCTPLAYAVAGPLAQRVFEPIMATEGAFARAAESLVGRGPGRGIGLLVVVIGIFIVISTLLVFFQPRVRFVEQELRDAVPQSLIETDSHAAVVVGAGGE
jgi:MFS transporter, DHA3 family, macrolide efflux protein